MKKESALLAAKYVSFGHNKRKPVGKNNCTFLLLFVILLLLFIANMCICICINTLISVCGLLSILLCELILLVKLFTFFASLLYFQNCNFALVTHVKAVELTI